MKRMSQLRAEAHQRSLSQQFEQIPGQMEFPGMPAPQERPWVDPTHSEQHADQQRRAALGPVIYTPSHKVPQIMKDGAYRTQHHTGESRGMYAPDTRKKIEDHFGWNHPVYGSIPGEGTAEVYGDTRLEVHPRYRAHTTLTDGDSLDKFGFGHRQYQPKGEFEDGSRPVPLREYTSSTAPSGLLGRGDPYVEAQIDTESGEIPVSDFTRATVLGELRAGSSRRRMTENDKAASALVGAGVPVMRSLHAVQPTLTNSIGSETEYDGPFDNAEGRGMWMQLPKVHMSQSDFVKMSRQAADSALRSST